MADATDLKSVSRNESVGSSPTGPTNKNMQNLMAIFTVLILLFAVCIGISSCVATFDDSAVTATIKGLDVKRSSESSDRYIVFTDKGVFENTDSMIRGKWNSSDLQNQLIDLQGKEVTLKVCGWRVNWLSWYPNILEIQ